MPNRDHFNDERPRERWRDDDDLRSDGRRDFGPQEPRRSFGGRDRDEGFNDRRFGADNRGAYSQGGEAWSDTSNRQSGGRGFTGGGFGDQGGYGAQWGKAGYGPLSQGSSYNSDGAQWGRGGYGGGGGRSERDQREGYGFYGQGGGRQWGGGDAERGYGFEGDPGGARDLHDHEPGYRNWREQQLAGHDRDYRRWRETQARKYDEDYGKWRGERHDAFSRDFHDWRTKNASPDDSRAQGVALTGEAARSADAQVQSVADGGSGHVKDADRSPKSAN